MAEALDRDSRLKRCGYCNGQGHIQTNKTACWKNRKLVKEDGEARVQEDLLETMKSHLFAIPAEVQEAMRLLRNGDRPKTAECIDYVLFHQKKANDQMKATMQLVGRIVEKMKDLDHKFAVPPDTIQAAQDRQCWDRAITKRGNEIGEVRRMTQDLNDYLTIVGDALDRGFTGDSEVFAAIERHKVACATGTDHASASANADGEYEVVRNPDEERVDNFMWVFGPMASRDKVCEHCHTRSSSDPWPFFFPYCSICGDQPSRHHGRCCPSRRVPREVERKNPFRPRDDRPSWARVVGEYNG